MSRRATVAEIYPRRARDPEGWWLCRRCGARIRRGRHWIGWCSNMCQTLANAEAGSVDDMRWLLHKRDRGVCAECGAEGRWECHHIVPVASGGSHSLDNLQTLCVPCHKAKTRAMRKESP